MKVDELKKDNLILEWLDTVNPSDNTRRNYLFALQAFTDWVKKTPNELIEEAEAEESNPGLKKRLRSIKRYLVDFRKDLQDKGLAPFSIKAHMTGVRSFYKTFDIDIPSLPKAGNKAIPLEKNKSIPNKDDIREALKVCDPLERAIMLVGASSGLSSNELRHLKVGHFTGRGSDPETGIDFTGGYDPETEITTIEIRRTKNQIDFITFLTPEASKAVQDYLNFRERTVKSRSLNRQCQLEKQKVFSDDNYLFIGRCIPETFLKSRKDEERKLEDDAITGIFRGISEKARKNSRKGNCNLIRSHNLRRYFYSALLNAGADSFFVEFLMAHKLDATRAAYFRASSEQLRDTYSQYIPYLTIQKPLDVSKSPEFQRVIVENKALKADNVRNVVERSELIDLREEVNTLKEFKEMFDNIEELDDERQKELKSQVKWLVEHLREQAKY
jgi:integrase